MARSLQAPLFHESDHYHAVPFPPLPRQVIYMLGIVVSPTFTHGVPLHGLVPFVRLSACTVACQSQRLYTKLPRKELLY